MICPDIPPYKGPIECQQTDIKHIAPYLSGTLICVEGDDAGFTQFRLRNGQITSGKIQINQPLSTLPDWFQYGATVLLDTEKMTIKLVSNE